MNAHNEQHDPASPVVKQNLTTQPAAAQEAVAYWRVTFRMYPENTDCCETFVRGPDRPTLDTLGISPRPVQIISTEPLYAAPVTSAPAEVARAQTNMDAGWYARREEHARSLGYAGVAEALATLERAQSLPADIRSFSQGASFVMDAEDAFEKCADDLEKILRTPAAPGIDLAGKSGLLRRARSLFDQDREYALERGDSHHAGQCTKDIAGIDALIDASPKGGSEARAYTTGHCENHKKPGGCPLHNLQCGYPQCDRKPASDAEVRDGE